MSVAQEGRLLETGLLDLALGYAHIEYAADDRLSQFRGIRKTTHCGFSC